VNPPVRFFINARNIDPNSINVVKEVDSRLSPVLTQANAKNILFLPYQFSYQNAPQGVTCAYLFTLGNEGNYRDDFIRHASINPHQVNSNPLEDRLQNASKNEELGHLTIHTWPEQEKGCSYTADLSLQRDNPKIIASIVEAFPGEYFIKREHYGDVTNVTNFSNGVGREVVGYFGKISNLKFLNKMIPEEWIRKIGEEAQFKIVGTAFQETERYLRVIAALSTSHMKVDIDKMTMCAAVDIYTCVDFIEDGKGNKILVNDEGDPELGMRIITDYLRPLPHPHNYVLSKPLIR